ncbi:MAG: hypothetical protein CMJ78_24270 [Planctomycetaceae bacterium]|nr:hypothetical protein [Planctomycetaceae bacterium]
MWESLAVILERFGIQTRSFRALLTALILMDLRGPHYTKATGTQPKHVISPLFWVVGQCLTLSAITSLVLFLRVDVFFYAFVGLAISMLVIATTVLVEFNEIVVDPRDLDIIGHRPVAPRTYSAARFCNLLFYVSIMFLALNIFPAIVGAALYDAGFWYAPAYLVASFCGSLLIVCVVLLLLSMLGRSTIVEKWKELLAWTQILLILVAGYGGQLMFRNKSYAVEMWAAYPPDWIKYLPPTWLARFVEQAAIEPQTTTLATAGGLLAITAGGIALTVWRISMLYRTMQPMTATSRMTRMPTTQIGTLAIGLTALVCSSHSERTGFWLSRTMLARDGTLRMRCLLSLNMVVAVVILGLGTSQFANPMIERDTALVTLPILAVYLIALAVPPIVHNMTFSSHSEASWVFRSAPIDAAEFVNGVCKTIQVFVVTPLCILLCVVMMAAWRAPVSALLHSMIAWLVSWPMAIATVWLVLSELPLSLEHSRGSSIGPLAIPMAGFSTVVMLLAGLHYFAASSIWFWLGLALACVAATWAIRPLANQRMRKFISVNA